MRRYYRKFMNSHLFSFVVKYKESDLWIGLDKTIPGLPLIVYEYIVNLRKQVESYQNQQFFESFTPIDFDEKAPDIVKDMILASKKANVGPMAAVAGAFAKFIGQFILKQVALDKLIVENGGDLYIYSLEETTIHIFSGSINLFLILPPGEFGVATSSGTIGHSKNFGRTDSTTIVTRDPTLSDAYATAISNKIKNVYDAKIVLKEKYEDIEDIVVVVDKTVVLNCSHEIRW
ncbi:UPF0280 family protein [Thermosipho ferrireducens]|uniref:UPF0280 family protein n=1 Tax=Thermosipho ferrireducens TaxID=2571116 RepID=A0ABX7S7F8_9BACT|nr:UPF0280 family protein [Thermosipho ferrireducens]QTA37547.1 UPF0280 family protein [Thermosipho ferrireducens]